MAKGRSDPHLDNQEHVPQEPAGSRGSEAGAESVDGVELRAAGLRRSTETSSMEARASGTRCWLTITAPRRQAPWRQGFVQVTGSIGQWAALALHRTCSGGRSNGGQKIDARTIPLRRA